MKLALVLTVLISATLVTFSSGQTFSYIDRPMLLSGGLKTSGEFTSIGLLHCSAINVKYRVEHSEIFGVVFIDGEKPDNTRVFSVEIEKAIGPSCVGTSSENELVGQYHEVMVPYGDCNIAWNHNETLFTYSAVILMRVHVYYTPSIYHEYRLRQPFTCSGDTGYQSEFNLEYLAQVEDLPTIGSTFSIEIKADLINEVSQVNHAQLPSQSLVMTFALQENMTDIYELFVDTCWGNFDQNRDQEPRITLIKSQGCQVQGLSQRIRENPITYRFPAFQFLDEAGAEEKMFIHCNINFCGKAGFRNMCQEHCSPKKVGVPLLQRIIKASTDVIPHRKYTRTMPQSLIYNNTMQSPVMLTGNEQYVLP